MSTAVAGTTPASTSFRPTGSHTNTRDVTPKVAQIDLSRKLTEAIWHMLTRNQPFAPTGAPCRLAA
jgi:hypothetical protein